MYSDARKKKKTALKYSVEGMLVKHYLGLCYIRSELKTKIQKSDVFFFVKIYVI